MRGAAFSIKVPTVFTGNGAWQRTECLFSGITWTFATPIFMLNLSEICCGCRQCIS